MFTQQGRVNSNKQDVKYVPAPVEIPADPNVVADLVIEKLKAQGLPKKGDPGDTPDIKDIAKVVLEKIIADDLLKKGDPGDPGVPPTVEELIPVLIDEIKKQELLEKGDPGDPGVPPTVEEIIGDLVKALVEGEHLPKGDPGDPGVPPTIEEVANYLKEAGLLLKGDPGDPAPISRIKKIHAVELKTNEAKQAELFKQPITPNSCISLKITVQAKGANPGVFYFAEKYATILIADDGKPQVIQKFTYAESCHNSLNLKVTASANHYGIAIMPLDGSMNWVAEVEEIIT